MKLTTIIALLLQTRADEIFDLADIMDLESIQKGQAISMCQNATAQTCGKAKDYKTCAHGVFDPCVKMLTAPGNDGILSKAGATDCVYQKEQYKCLWDKVKSYNAKKGTAAEDFEVEKDAEELRVRFTCIRETKQKCGGKTTGKLCGNMLKKCRKAKFGMMMKDPCFSQVAKICKKKRKSRGRGRCFKNSWAANKNKYLACKAGSVEQETAAV